MELMRYNGKRSDLGLRKHDDPSETLNNPSRIMNCVPELDALNRLFLHLEGCWWGWACCVRNEVFLMMEILQHCPSKDLDMPNTTLMALPELSVGDRVLVGGCGVEVEVLDDDDLPS